MVRRFNREDYEYLVALNKSHGDKGFETLPLDMLPYHGMMCIKDGVVIAIGFLRMVEPCFAQIDTLVSNAQCSSELRHFGVSKVVDKLIFDAKFMGIKAIYSHTKDEGIIKRAQAMGFKVIPEIIISLGL